MNANRNESEKQSLNINIDVLKYEELLINLGKKSPALLQKVGEQSLEEVIRLNYAKKVSLRREILRKQKKYGTNSDKIKHEQNQLIIVNELNTQLNTQKDEICREIPKRDPGTLTIHGKVLNLKKAPLKGMIVSAVLTSKCTQLESTKTCNNGYFKLGLEACESEKRDSDNQEQSTKQSKPTDSRNLTIHLEVHDKDNNLVLKDKNKIPYIGNRIIASMLEVDDTKCAR